MAKNNHPDYRTIEISEENLAMYPERDGFVEGVPAMEMPDAETLCEEESALKETEIGQGLEQAPGDIFRPTSIVPNQFDEPLVATKLKKIMSDKVKGLPRQNTNEEATGNRQTTPEVPGPQHNTEAVSEFIEGFFSKAFPYLWPDKKGDPSCARPETVPLS